jgi:3-oxoadipate enol-lactonase
MGNLANNINLTTNGLNVSYSDRGPEDAPVIIFIHGFPLNKSMWDMQMEALPDEYRIIAYDVRGHGDSDAGNESFSIEIFVNDLLSLMDALKINKTVLCGLSMGGYIALNAVENFPEHFDALILSDTHCSADTPEAKDKRLVAIASIKKKGVEEYAEASIKNLFAPESLATKKAEIALVRAMIVETSKQTLYNSMHALAMRKETCSKLSEIKIPVLILVGNEDIITPPAAAKFMHENIRNSTLFILEHAGHLSNMENPFEFNYQVRKFVETVY